MDTLVRSYAFWLAVVSPGCFVLERVWPWRKDQRVLRGQLTQDVFWLIFNGHYAGVGLAYASAWVLGRLDGLGLRPPEWTLLDGIHPGVQFVGVIVLKDFIEWNVHRLLHRVPLLWELHKVHHSIEEMDWIGNFRFHWMEIVIYGSILYFPMTLLGADASVLLAVAVVSTLIGHLNHSNVRLDWGPLRYLFNSPRMHIWHHAAIASGERGTNFAVVFSAWDWLFRTAKLPGVVDNPRALGFDGLAQFPRSVFARMLHPLPISRIRFPSRRGAG